MRVSCNKGEQHRNQVTCCLSPIAICCPQDLSSQSCSDPFTGPDFAELLWPLPACWLRPCLLKSKWETFLNLSVMLQVIWFPNLKTLLWVGRITHSKLGKRSGWRSLSEWALLGLLFHVVTSLRTSLEPLAGWRNQMWGVHPHSLVIGAHRKCYHGEMATFAWLMDKYWEMKEMRLKEQRTHNKWLRKEDLVPHRSSVTPG